MNLFTGPTLLAFRPFLDPLPLDDVWFLLVVPLSLGVAIVYRAVRAADQRAFYRSVLIMTAQTVAAMIALGAGFFTLVEFVLPLVAPR